MTERVRIHILWAIVALIVCFKLMSLVDTSTSGEKLTIDSTAYNKAQAVILHVDSLLDAYHQKDDSIIIIRTYVPEKVFRFTDDDLMHWTDSFSTAHHLPAGAYLQANDSMRRAR